MRNERSIRIVVSIAYFVVAGVTFVLLPWGVRLIIALVVLQLALGGALGRWWAILLPIPVFAIRLGPANDCSGDLCGDGFYAFFLVLYIAAAAGIVALGMTARWMFMRYRRRSDSGPPAKGHC